MVKVYGTSASNANEREHNSVSRQIAFTLAISALALTVCCALIASADLKGNRVALYGLGSGEEQDADNSMVTTFETFAGQDEYMEELLGDEYYQELFKEIADSEPISEVCI
mmetsp:Transcript_16139/g.54072  ORF Transcript_16139/g.54072 Transcript_16139/m.54072 type:complete len:111 (-) Transcript_16139:949-1281(-)